MNLLPLILVEMVKIDICLNNSRNKLSDLINHHNINKLIVHTRQKS